MENLELLEATLFDGEIAQMQEHCIARYEGPIVGTDVELPCPGCLQPIHKHEIRRGRFTVPQGAAEDALIAWLAQCIVGEGATVEYEIVLSGRGA